MMHLGLRRLLPVLTIVLGTAVLLQLASPSALAAAKKIRTPAPMSSLRFSQSVAEIDGELRIVNVLVCTDSTSNACRSICGALRCEWPDQVCRNCYGTGSTVLRNLFSQFAHSYDATPVSADEYEIHQTVAELARSGAVFIGRKSVYDFFTTSRDAHLIDQLARFCGIDDGFVVLQLDEDRRPSTAVAIVCSSSPRLKAFALRPRRFNNENQKTQFNNLTGENHVEVIP